MRSRIGFLFLACALFSLVAAAEDKPAPRTADVRGYRAAPEVKAILEGTPETPNTPATPGAEAAPESALTKLAKLPTSLRFDGSKAGDIVHIYVFYRDDKDEQDLAKKARPEVKVTEKARRPLIVNQLQTLAKIAAALQASVGPDPAVAVEIFPYKLKLRRADLTINAAIKKNPRNESITDELRDSKADWYIVIDFTNLISDEDADPTNAGTTKASVQTGPREGWFISTDVPLTSIGDVKVDDEAKNIELADTPDVFYAGFNYCPFGDVLRTPARFAEAIDLKVLLKVSRRPSDSFGVGLGLRPGLFADRHPLLQVFDTLSPYVAYTRTRVEEEQKNPDGTSAGKIRFKRNDFVVGISLNLDKALDFVKGKDDGGDGGNGEGEDGQE